MARPTTFTFAEFWILVGDGESPEMFSAPCGLTSKGFDETANTLDTNVPDCDDPEAPAYIERAVDTLSSQISGTGILAGEAFPTWRDWYFSAQPRNIRIGFGEMPDVSIGGYYEGPFILSQFNKNATRGQKVQVEITAVSAAQWTWVEVVT